MSFEKRPYFRVRWSDFVDSEHPPSFRIDILVSRAASYEIIDVDSVQVLGVLKSVYAPPLVLNGHWLFVRFDVAEDMAELFEGETRLTKLTGSFPMIKDYRLLQFEAWIPNAADADHIDLTGISQSGLFGVRNFEPPCGDVISIDRFLEIVGEEAHFYSICQLK